MRDPDDPTTPQWLPIVIRGGAVKVYGIPFAEGDYLEPAELRELSAYFAARADAVEAYLPPPELRS